MPHLADYPPMLLDERPFDFDEPGWICEIQFNDYRKTRRSQMRAACNRS